MWSFSMYITQIKPLENGDYESVLKRPPTTPNNEVISSTKLKNLLGTVERKGLCGRFSIYITQIKSLENGDYEGVLKRPTLTSNNAVISRTKFRNLLGTIERKRLCARFSIISHKSNPWKTGITKGLLKRPPLTSNNASYNQKKPDICSLSEWDYEVVFHLYHTNQAPVTLTQCSVGYLFSPISRLPHWVLS